MILGAVLGMAGKVAERVIVGLSIIVLFDLYKERKRNKLSGTGRWVKNRDRE